MKFKSDIEIQAGVEAGGSTGSNGQVLSSTGSGVTWINIGTVDGSGTANRITKWLDANTITNSLFTDNGSTVSLSTNGGSNTFDLSHTSGSGIALNITKGGNGEALVLNKTSGSGNALSVTGDSYFNGNVGIGTTDPSYKLNVDGTGRFLGDVTVANASTPAIRLIDTTNDLTARFRAANNYAYIDVDSSDTVSSTRLIFQIDGSEALHLDNSLNANFAGNITVGGNILATGTILGSNLSGTNTGDQDLSGYLTNLSSETITYVNRIHTSDGTSPDNFGYDNRYQTFNYGVSSGVTGPLLSFGGLGSGYPMQITGAYSGGGNLFKVRTRNGDTTTWNSWRTLWHDGNDGSGSGLDADLLDGQHASAFAPVAHTHTWADINGETANSVNGWGGLRHQTNSGYIDFGPANSGHAHIYTDRPDFYFNKSLIVNGNSTINTADIRTGALYDSDNTNYYINPATTGKSAYLRGDIEIINEVPIIILNDYTATNTTNQLGYISYQQNGTETAWIGFGSGSNNYFSVTNTSGIVSINGDYTLHNASSRAPIFYDSNNTTFYLDPASTSQVNHLHCASFLSFGSFTVGTQGTQFEGYSTHSVVRTDSAQLNFFMGKSSTGVGNVMSITDTGRVGIGTTTPDPFKLSVDGTIGVTGTLNNTLGSYYIDHPGVQSWKIGVHTANTSTLSIGNDLGGAFASKILNLTNAGKVGIGTTDPSDKLQIDAANSQLRLRDTDDGTYTQFSSSSNKLAIRQNSTSASHIWLTSSGNVGIGTDNPGYKLDVNGSLHSTNLTIADYIYHEGDTNTYMQFHAADQWRVVTGGVERFEVNNGQAYASHSLRAPIFYDSNNTAYYFDGSSTGDSIRVAGDIVAYYSDERLKDKKGNIENALEKVLSLNGFYYEPNEKAQSLGYKKKLEVGVSAQEVEEVLPEIIKDAPIGHGYKTLDYSKLTPLLIEAIKEQQKQIEELKKMIS